MSKTDDVESQGFQRVDALLKEKGFQRIHHSHEVIRDYTFWVSIYGRDIDLPRAVMLEVSHNPDGVSLVCFQKEIPTAVRGASPTVEDVRRAIE